MFWTFHWILTNSFTGGILHTFALYSLAPLLILTFLGVKSFSQMKISQTACLLPRLSSGKTQKPATQSTPFLFVCTRNELIDVFGKVTAWSTCPFCNYFQKFGLNTYKKIFLEKLLKFYSGKKVRIYFSVFL